jgi:hypothetical protein
VWPPSHHFIRERMTFNEENEKKKTVTERDKDKERPKTGTHKETYKTNKYEET